MSTVPTPVGTLIVGAGQAGLQVAASLRTLGAAGPITLVGGESWPPYQRPPLSKAFLHGNLSDERLYLRNETFYRDHRIELICGEWVDSIRLSDPGRGTGVAETRSGRRLVFDRLALAVGGAPRRLQVPGVDLDGVHYLRTIGDALALRAELHQAQRVVVVGGGFVGLEIAAAASAAGKAVTVLEVSDRLLARAVAPVVSDFYLAAHRRRGTSVLLNTEVMRFTRARNGHHVAALELSDGRVLPADMVVIGIGLVANTELATQLGLECAGGIVVDEGARTSVRSVVAVGDCTAIAHPRHGRMRLESVQNAIGQAKAAAASLLSADPPETGIPWFWSDQGDLKLQIAGIAAGYDEIALRGDPATEQFSTLYYRDGRLVAIDAVNSPRDYMVVRKILHLGLSVPPSAAADADVPLRDFLDNAGAA